MIAWVALYGKDVAEKPTTYTLDVRDQAHALAVVPQCLANHRWKCGQTCEVTHWTVSMRPAGKTFIRIVGTGAFANG